MRMEESDRGSFDGENGGCTGWGMDGVRVGEASWAGGIGEMVE